MADPRDESGMTVDAPCRAAERLDRRSVEQAELGVANNIYVLVLIDPGSDIRTNEDTAGEGGGIGLLEQIPAISWRGW